MDVLPAEFLILIVALASALAGGLLVWVIGYIGGGGQKRPRKPSSPPEAEGERNLLSVRRVGKGQPAIFVQGRRYRHLREITDPQVGRETIEALKAVLAFTEGWLPTLRQASPQLTLRKSAVDEQTFLEQLRRSNLFSIEKPPGPVGRLKQRTSRRPLKPLLPPADEINELVQQRLQKWPDLVQHTIRLTTNADGSLCIHVGLQTFNTVNDIPDPKVRALIQDAIREWESTSHQTP